MSVRRAARSFAEEPGSLADSLGEDVAILFARPAQNQEVRVENLSSLLF